MMKLEHRTGIIVEACWQAEEFIVMGQVATSEDISEDGYDVGRKQDMISGLIMLAL